MGYTFKIGDLITETYTDDDDGHSYTRYDVHNIVLDDAPEFPNDEMTGKSNGRHPSYSTWRIFCDATCITDIFYENRNIRGGHPGYFDITEEIVVEISMALATYKKTSTKPPGFDGFPAYDPLAGDWVIPDEGKYDGYLARLIWLDFWVNWTFNNCKQPAIINW